LNRLTFLRRWPNIQNTTFFEDPEPIRSLLDEEAQRKSR
jgi:hypothetical protein